MPNNKRAVVERGYTPIPNTLIRNCAALDLSAPQFLVLVCISSFCWGDKTFASPSIRLICQQTGLVQMTVRNAIKGLADKGLMVVTYRDSKANTYDLSPLYAQLLTLSQKPQVVECEEQEPLHSLEPTPTPKSTNPLYLLEPNKTIQEQEENNVSTACRAGVAATQAPQRASISAHQGTLGLSGLVVHMETQTAPRKRTPVTFEQRAAKHDAKKPTEYNSADLEIIFARSWRALYGDVVPLPGFNVVERKAASVLISEIGAERAANMVRGTVENWEALSARLRLSGAPNIRILTSGYRGAIFAYLSGKTNGAAHATSRPQYDSAQPTPANITDWGS